MSLGKLPVIKGLVAGSQGRRRYKSDLTVDMISPPMADFRHTMHVGRGGDVFGDTSFLSNHGGPQGDTDSSPSSSSSSSKAGGGFFSRTLRHVRKTPVRTRGGSRELGTSSPPPPPISPIIKNAISLPQLDLDPPNGGPPLHRALFPSSPSTPQVSGYCYGVHSGFVTLPRLSRSDKQAQDSPGVVTSDLRRSSLQDHSAPSLECSDSLDSFTLDLGPSLMSEVFGLIDSPVSNHSPDSPPREASQSFGEEEAGPSLSVAVSSPVDDLSDAGEDLKGQHLNGRTSPYCETPEEPEWEAVENGDPLKRATPEVAVGPPCKVEPAMEAERFQRAADVLARHYGGAGFLKGQRQAERGDTDSSRPPRKAPYAYPEEEDEIKV
ncbi:cdc42 effector protein 1 [Amia ocellicauda]|uniref:cdc42 effector protein 1 n=1 Tax=Amia ocellicauda TaxID=2972642 RepID=UPI003463DB26|nr:BORG5 protein [Amia calva]